VKTVTSVFDPEDLESRCHEACKISTRIYDIALQMVLPIRLFCSINIKECFTNNVYINIYNCYILKDKGL